MDVRVLEESWVSTTGLIELMKNIYTNAYFEVIHFSHKGEEVIYEKRWKDKRV